MTDANGTAVYRWMILLLTMLVQSSVSMLRQAPSALGPLLARDFGVGRAQLGLLSSAIIGGMMLTTLAMGLLIDRRGEREVVSWGWRRWPRLSSSRPRWGHSGGFFAFSVGQLRSLELYSGRLEGDKRLVPSTSKRPGDGGEANRHTGRGLLAALLLPPLAVGLGWASALAVGAGVTLLVALCFATFFREPPTKREGAEPRVPLRSIVRNWGFLTATGYSFVLVGAQWSATAYLTLFLHEEAGVPVVAAGVLLAVLQIGGIAGRIGWGAASDRLGRRKPVMVIVGLMAVPTCLAMAFVGQHTPRRCSQSWWPSSDSRCWDGTVST